MKFIDNLKRWLNSNQPPTMVAIHVPTEKFPEDIEEIPNNITVTRIPPPDDWNSKVNGYMYLLHNHQDIETYIIQSKKNESEIAAWFAGYKDLPPRCSSCGGIFFPKTPIGTNGNLHMHVNTKCADTGSFHSGYLQTDGKIDCLYPGCVSSMMHALKTGESIVGNINHPSLSDFDFIMVNYFNRIESLPEQ